ncbi:MAG TPA: DUF2325 domain-containing protein [Epsilonproteobacteria bacterium]|nr:DUF2325 domain-containing protein [Campylobacterota bacterium]
MNVLILGGDKINPLLNALYELGITSVTHWTGRNLKNGSKKSKQIPSKTDFVLMLTNFLNHNAMLHYKQEAKSKGVCVAYTTRNIDAVKCEVLKLIGNNPKLQEKACLACKKRERCDEKIR